MTDIVCLGTKQIAQQQRTGRDIEASIIEDHNIHFRILEEPSRRVYRWGGPWWVHSLEHLDQLEP